MSLHLATPRCLAAVQAEDAGAVALHLHAPAGHALVAGEALLARFVLVLHAEAHVALRGISLRGRLDIHG